MVINYLIKFKQICRQTMELKEGSNFYLTLQTIKNHIQNIVLDTKTPFHNLLYNQLKNILGDQSDEQLQNISNVDIIQSTQRIFQSQTEALQTIVHLAYKLIDITIQQFQNFAERQYHYQQELNEHRQTLSDIQNQKHHIQNDINLFKSQLSFAEQTIVQYQNLELMSKQPIEQVMEESFSVDQQQDVIVYKLTQQMQVLADSIYKLELQIQAQKHQINLLNHDRLLMLSEMDRKTFEIQDTCIQLQKSRQIHHQMIQQNVALKQKIFQLQSSNFNKPALQPTSQIKIKRQTSQTSFNKRFMISEDKTEEIMVRKTSCTSFNFSHSNQSRKGLFGDIQIDCSDKNPQDLFNEQDIFNQEVIRNPYQLSNSKSNKSIKKPQSKLHKDSYQNLFIIRELSRKSIVNLNHCQTHTKNNNSQKMVSEIGVNTNWEQKIVFKQIEKKTFWNFNNIKKNVQKLAQNIFIFHPEEQFQDQKSGIMKNLHNFIVTKRIKVK